MFSIHCRKEPSSLLEKTSLQVVPQHEWPGKPKTRTIEFKLGAVLVDETKIHQMGMSVNTANRPHNSVTMFTVRRLTPYNRSGTASLLRASRRARRCRRHLVSSHGSGHTTAPFRRCDTKNTPEINDDHEGQDHCDGGGEIVELGRECLLYM